MGLLTSSASVFRLVSRIQTLRKETGLEVTDRIDLHIRRNGDARFEAAVRHHAKHILAETLAATQVEQILVDQFPNACALSLTRSAN